MQTAGANTDQIEFWNGRSAKRWVQFQERQDRMLHPLGHRALESGLPQPGERVLDVGCGCGDTTIDLARKVAPSGTATGIDVSTMMLARAQERTAGTNLNISFIDDDAQTHGFADGSFDVVYSRFGIMFFADPKEAFVNLCRALGTCGRLIFVCWRAREENPWMTIPVQVAAQYLPRPQPSLPRAWRSPRRPAQQMLPRTPRSPHITNVSSIPPRLQDISVKCCMRTLPGLVH